MIHGRIYNINRKLITLFKLERLQFTNFAEPPFLHIYRYKIVLRTIYIFFLQFMFLFFAELYVPILISCKTK